jgi:hypothetical protein
MENIGVTCIHCEAVGRTGLCVACKAEYDEDPESWIEYGDHPAGIENQKRLKEELEAWRPVLAQHVKADPDIPF